MPLTVSPRPDASLIVPLYRCKGYITDKIDRVASYLAQQPEHWEVVFVDDGSGDGTAEEVQSHIMTLPGCRLIQMSRNQGKGAAVRRGMRAARGKYRMFTDCDLAYPISQVSVILRALRQGADVAIANRRDPDSLAEVPTAALLQANRRERMGRIFNAVLRAFGLSTIPDTQAGLKGFRAEVVPLFDYLTITRFAFDIELLVVLKEHRKRVCAVPVRYRLDGEPTTVCIYKDVPQMLFSIMQIAINRARGRYLPSFQPERAGNLVEHRLNEQEQEHSIARI